MLEMPELHIRHGINPRRKVLLQSTKVKGVGDLECFDIRPEDAEFKDFPAGICSCLCLVFPHYAPFLLFRMVIYYMFEVCDLRFYFYFKGVTIKILP